jgi:hypothetical protein
MASYSALRQARTPTANYPDETYRLSGLNMVAPDQLITNGESPYTINTRMFAREAGEKRVAIRTRKGPGFYTIPIGETLDQSNISTTGAADQGFNQAQRIATKFVAGATGPLTMVDLNIRTNTGIGTVLVEIRSNSGTLPDVTPNGLLSTSGVTGGSISSTYGWVKFRFLNAPSVVAGQTYWIIIYSQDDLTGSYQWSSTTSATGAALSNNSGGSYTLTGYAMNARTFVSSPGAVKGWYRAYYANGSKVTYIAHGTSIYMVNDVDGTTTAIKTGLNALSTRGRFAKINDQVIYVNGYDQPFEISSSQVITTLTNVPFIPDNVWVHKNRVFFSQPSDKSRIFFSDAANENSYPSVNFLYFPAPRSSDPITAMVTFQDNLVVFTAETKYILYGSDLGQFTIRQALGTKGAASQEAVDADRNFCYFKADDQFYTFNGSSDQLLSDKVQPEFDNIISDNNTAVKVYNNQVRVYYTPSGQAANNRVLLYNDIYRQWFMDTGSYTGLPGVFQQDQGNPLVEASSLYGALFYAEVAYNDLGGPIDMKYWTPYNKYISAMSKDRVRKFHPEIRPGDTTFVMQIGKDVDFANSPLMQNYTVSSGGNAWGGSTTVWGAFKWGGNTYQDTPVSMSGRGQHTQYRFERYGANTPVELYGYAALIRSSRLK